MVTIRILLGTILALTSVRGFAADAPGCGDPAANVRLTPQHLHRLQLEKQRQTPRWSTFENRVQTVPDSPQRGFELALYYLVTHDAERGRQAVAWAASHANEASQRAIVAAWCSDLLSADQKAQWPAGQTQARATTSGDPKTSPNERAALLLLSLQPSEFEHPFWQTHIYGLELVANYPNLPNAQFLQSWVLQSDQTIREGPGVAYEFFWADPYLPGVSYQNMEPWVYDNTGRLFARSDWTGHACWISISTHGVQEQNCPPDWRSKPASFGHLTLVPFHERCLQMEPAGNPSGNNDSLILWNLPPGQKVTYHYQNKQLSGEAGPAGMLRAPGGLEGKVCVAR
jgi:hypothetical protein